MGLLEDAVSYAKETQPAQAEAGLLEQAVAFAKGVPQAAESEGFDFTAPAKSFAALPETAFQLAGAGATWFTGELGAGVYTVGQNLRNALLRRSDAGDVALAKSRGYTSELAPSHKSIVPPTGVMPTMPTMSRTDIAAGANFIRESVPKIMPAPLMDKSKETLDDISFILEKLLFWHDPIIKGFNSVGLPDVGPIINFVFDLAAFKGFHKTGNSAYGSLRRLHKKTVDGRLAKNPEKVLADFEKELEGIGLKKEDLSTPEARQAWLNKQPWFEDYGPSNQKFQTAEWLRKDSARSKPVNKPEVVPEPPVETPGEPVIVSGAKTPAETNLEAQAQQQQVQQLQRQVEPQSILTRDLPPEARRITEAAQRTPKQEIQEIPPEVSGLDQPVLMTADGRLFYKDGRPVNLEEPAKAAPVEKPVEPVAEPVPVDNSHKNLMEGDKLKAEKAGKTQIDLDRLDDWVELELEDLYKEGGKTRLHTIAKQLLDTGELDSPGLLKTFKTWYAKQLKDRQAIEGMKEAPPDVAKVDPEIGRPPGEGIEAPRKQVDLGTSDLIAEVKQENTPLMRDDGTPIKSRAMAAKKAKELGRVGEIIKNPNGEGWLVKPNKAQRKQLKKKELEAWDKILEEEGLTVDEGRAAQGGIRDLFDIIDNERGSVSADIISEPIKKLMEVFGKNPKAGSVLNGLSKSNITKDDLRVSRFDAAISTNYKPNDRIDWNDLASKAEKGYLDVGKTVLGPPEKVSQLLYKRRELEKKESQLNNASIRQMVRDQAYIEEVQRFNAEVRRVNDEFHAAVRENPNAPSTLFEFLSGYNVRGDELGAYREHLFTNSKLSDYKEAHWGEHGQGVFAHSRRTPMQLDDGVKALVAHDVQSVLHQKGLEKGYLTDSVTDKAARISKLEADYDAMTAPIHESLVNAVTHAASMDNNLVRQKLLSAGHGKNSVLLQYVNDNFPIGAHTHRIMEKIVKIIGDPILTDKWNTYRDNLRRSLDISIKIAELRNDTGVPDAPYKADWYKLVMRDQVNEAVRTGMDGIAWTTADFQAKASADHTSTQVRTLYDEKIPSFIRKEYGVEPVKKTSQGTEVWYAPVGELSTKPLRGNTMLEVISNLLTNERGELRLSADDFKKIKGMFASGKYDNEALKQSLIAKGASADQVSKFTEEIITKAQATGESKWLKPGQDMNEILPRRQKANGNLAPAISRGAAHNLTQAKDMDARALGESWSLETSNRGMERAGEAIKQEFYHPLRKATAEFQKEKKRVFKEVDKIAKTFSQSEKERIYSYATQLQEGGKEILQLQGKEVVTQLTPKELAAYNKMRTDFKAMYDRLNAAREAAGESKFPAVDNYFTLANDIAWLRDEFGIGLYDNYKTVNGYLFGDHKTTPSSFHTKSRATDRQMLGINLYLDKAGHSHKLNGEQVKRVREYAQQALEGESSIALSPEEMAVYNKAKKVVVRTLNDPFMAYKRYMNESLDYAHRGPELARQKELLSDTYGLHELAPNTHLFLSQWRDAQTGMRLPWDVSNLKWRRRIQRANKNVVMGYLAAAPQSMLRQFGAFPHTFSIAGHHAMTGILDAMSPAKWKMAWDKSDALHTRSPEVSLDIARGYESQNKVMKVLDKASEAELTPLDITDKFTATASWLAFYRQAQSMKGLTTDAQRVRYADDWTAKTQGSASMLDRAPLQRSLIGGTLTGLQTFAINEFNFIAKDILGIKNPEVNTKTKMARTARFVAGVALFNWLQEEMLGMNAGAPTPIKTAREKADALGKDGELGKKEIVQVGAAGLSELANYLPLIGSALKYGTQLGGPTMSLLYEMSKDLNKKGTVDPKDVATLLGRGDIRQALKMHEAYSRNGTVTDIMLGNYVPKPKESKKGPVIP